MLRRIWRNLTLWRSQRGPTSTRADRTRSQRRQHALAGSATDVPADTLTYAWDLDNNGSYETAGQNPVFNAANFDGDVNYTVNFQVSDGDATTTASTTIHVTNTAPTAILAGGGAVNEGSSASVSFSGQIDLERGGYGGRLPLRL